MAAKKTALVSYAKFEGETIVNWKKVLTGFINSEEIDCEVYENYKNLACNWGTCACGQSPDLVHRDDNGKPIDYDLGEWGTCFTNAFVDRNFGLALSYLKRIELRVPFVLSKQKYNAEYSLLLKLETLGEAEEKVITIQDQVEELKAALKQY